MTTVTKDPIADAIAAVDQSRPEARQNFGIRLHTGRGVMINVPADVTPEELLGLVAYIATGLPAALAEARGPNLVVARGRVPRT